MRLGKNIITFVVVVCKAKYFNENNYINNNNNNSSSRQQVNLQTNWTCSLALQFNEWPFIDWRFNYQLNRSKFCNYWPMFVSNKNIVCWWFNNYCGRTIIITRNITRKLSSSTNNNNNNNKFGKSQGKKPSKLFRKNAILVCKLENWLMTVMIMKFGVFFFLVCAQETKSLRNKLLLREKNRRCRWNATCVQFDWALTLDHRSWKLPKAEHKRVICMRIWWWWCCCNLHWMKATTTITVALDHAFKLQDAGIIIGFGYMRDIMRMRMHLQASVIFNCITSWRKQSLCVFLYAWASMWCFVGAIINGQRH